MPEVDYGKKSHSWAHQFLTSVLPHLILLTLYYFLLVLRSEKPHPCYLTNIFAYLLSLPHQTILWVRKFTQQRMLERCTKSPEVDSMPENRGGEC